MPCDLFDAVRHAATILSWYEHLTEDELPPRWMWALSDELEIHFEWVKDARKTGSTDEDKEIGGPVLQNEYARGRGRNKR